MNHGVTDVSKAFLEEQLFLWRHLLQLSVREGAVVQERILFVNDVESQPWCKLFGFKLLVNGVVRHCKW